LDAKKINIDQYSYNLPEDRIAKYPLEDRDESRLLIFKDEKLSEQKFKYIANILPKNSLLVFNNTKVIRARLRFLKTTGARIEVFCLEPYNPEDYNLAFQKTHECYWECMVGNLKKWKDESIKLDVTINDNHFKLLATKIKSLENTVVVKFTWNSNTSFGDIIEKVGNVPIPPYLNRKSEKIDKTRYQTIYAKYKGSVAAPTAGLHFTENVLKSLEKSNIKTAELTLHVSAGTFKPVSSKKIGDHQMHTEHFTVSKKLIEKLIENKDNIIAVGTTSLRTLESLYYIGSKIYKNPFTEPDAFNIKQWEPYKSKKTIKLEEALKAILDYMNKNKIVYIETSTQIIIVPGYKIKVANALITNYHQPKSTLLLLVAAFVGDSWKKIYDFALKRGFRFLSYGDSSLLFR